MKGPYERLKYDFRRVFECPKCRKRIRVPGHVTSQRCTCDPGVPGGICMKLIEENPRRPQPKK